MSQIVVVPYEPIWASEFKKAKDFFSQLLGDLPAEIQHVGSTSVEGLWAKPILDIDIVVKNQDEVIKVIKQLETVGYKHRGNLGVEGREAFSYKEDNPLITWMNHHLYVCLEGSENYQNHILLKAYLEKHPEAVETYSRLKRQLAKQFPNDINAYIEGKTALITSFLAESGMSSESLDSITAINQNHNQSTNQTTSQTTSQIKPEIIVTFYGHKLDEALYKYAVIMTRYQNKWVFVRHKLRKTWEIPGGKRESGETIMETASRELEEETGARVYQTKAIGGYGVKVGEEGQETYGLLCYAAVESFNETLEFEIQERAYFESCPDQMTYPDIQPALYEWGEKYLETIKSKNQSY